MKRVILVISLFMTGLTLLWATDAKETLEEARKNYKESVQQHGQDSAEAHAAREKLRSSRREFHSHHHKEHQSDESNKDK